MKRKILSLILAALCLIAVMASCSETEDTTVTTEPPVICTGHVDADLNSACDNCACPVLTVVKNVPAVEEVVEQIVSAIPTDATLVTIYDCTAPEYEKNILTNPEKLTDRDWYNIGSELDNDSVYVLKYKTFEETGALRTDPETGAQIPYIRVIETTRVIDVNTGKDVIPVMKSTYFTHESEMTRVGYDVFPISTADGTVVGFGVRCDKYMESSSYSYYTLGGKKLEGSEYAAAPTATVDMVVGYAYITYGDIVYVVDLADDTIIYSEDVNKFVNRPYFDAVNEEKGYGFIQRDGYVYVYNMKEWIDCIYAYELKLQNSDVFYLANGNILVQSLITKHSSAVNYDVILDGVKYDITYTVVDVAAKTATEIEFGYYINYVSAADDNSFYLPTVRNEVVCQKIINKDVNTNEIVLLTDDNLGIITDAKTVLPNTQIIDFVKIAKNRFIGTVVYSDNTSVDKLYNEKGEELAILPNSYFVTNDFIVVGDSLYDFSMKLIYDAKAEENLGNTVMVNEDYVLITTAMNDIYYIADSKTPMVSVGKSSATSTIVESGVEGEEPIEILVEEVVKGVYWYNDDMFVISTDVYTLYDESGNAYDTAREAHTYEIYNANKELISTAEMVSAPEDAIVCDNGMIIIFEDGSAYLF